MTTVDGSRQRRDVSRGMPGAPDPGPGMTGGELAEQWTATELGELRRHGWALVNQVTLTRPDIHHVLIGPGGVIAIESELSTPDWNPAGPQLDAAARRARRHALRLTLWHGLRPAKVGAVGSAVILWGPGADALAAPFGLGGTIIVPGHTLAVWRDSLTRGRLTAGQVSTARRALEGRCRARAVT